MDIGYLESRETYVQRIDTSGSNGSADHATGPQYKHTWLSICATSLFFHVRQICQLQGLVYAYDISKSLV